MTRTAPALAPGRFVTSAIDNAFPLHDSAAHSRETPLDGGGNGKGEGGRLRENTAQIQVGRGLKRIGSESIAYM